MKMATIHKLSNYKIQENDKFFLDANIWIYLYCSIGNASPQIVADYSNFYGLVKQSGNEVITNTLLVSEFINTYTRLEFNIKKSQDGISHFKRDFRSNPKYQPIIENINLITEKKILKDTIKKHDGFHEFDETTFFNSSQTFDFNDEYYCYNAEKYNYKIVTHDRDFLNTPYNVEIITGLS